MEVLTLYAHSEKLDYKNRNTMWIDAYALEMSNLLVPFEILPPGKLPPPGWTKSSGRLIWDVKMDLHKISIGEGRSPYS